MADCDGLRSQTARAESRATVMPGQSWSQSRVGVLTHVWYSQETAHRGTNWQYRTLFQSMYRGKRMVWPQKGTSMPLVSLKEDLRVDAKF